MAQHSKKFYNPFAIHIDPMERLLLINFEKDPDAVYVGFEPQVFNDSINGKGHLIIGWRLDGKVDVYHDPSLKLNPEKYDIAGKGLANMVAQKMRQVYYEIKKSGVQANYSFKDIHGREVIIKIHEKNEKKRKPFGLLAPMGDAAENPSAMPLVFLHEFYFVRKKHAEIEVSIAGKKHQLDQLPLPMDGSKMYFTRYSPEPLIVTLNPAFNGQLAAIEAEDAEETITRGNYEFKLEWVNEQLFIKRITRINKVHPVSLEFNDPFPDVVSLENNESVKGKFTIEAHPSVGKIIGEYSINKREDKIDIVMIPSKGWNPRPTKLSLRFLYTVAKVFKKWPTTYRWTANINQKPDGAYFMISKWERAK